MKQVRVNLSFWVSGYCLLKEDIFGIGLSYV